MPVLAPYLIVLRIWWLQKQNFSSWEVGVAVLRLRIPH
jgi:hypothetical protein